MTTDSAPVIASARTKDGWTATVQVLVLAALLLWSFTEMRQLRARVQELEAGGDVADPVIRFFKRRATRGGGGR